MEREQLVGQIIEIYNLLFYCVQGLIRNYVGVNPHLLSMFYVHSLTRPTRQLRLSHNCVLDHAMLCRTDTVQRNPMQSDPRCLLPDKTLCPSVPNSVFSLPFAAFQR